VGVKVNSVLVNSVPVNSIDGAVNSVEARESNYTCYSCCKV